MTGSEGPGARILCMSTQTTHGAPTSASSNPKMAAARERMRRVSFPLGIIDEVEKVTGHRYLPGTIRRWIEFGVLPLGGIRPHGYSSPHRQGRCTLQLLQAEDGSEYSTVGAIRAFLGRVWGTTEEQS